MTKMPDDLVRRMYAMYSDGASCAAVAEHFGKHRQNVWDCFRRRGLALRGRMDAVQMLRRTFAQALRNGLVDYNEAGCWRWLGAMSSAGYGRVGDTGYAHRESWKHFKGAIPVGLFVCHRCDNPPCVNPTHLFLGTAQDNTRDACRKGRMGHALAERQVRMIRRRYVPWSRTDGLRAIGREMGLSHTVIAGAIRGYAWVTAE